MGVSLWAFKSCIFSTLKSIALRNMKSNWKHFFSANRVAKLALRVHWPEFYAFHAQFFVHFNQALKKILNRNFCNHQQSHALIKVHRVAIEFLISFARHSNKVAGRKIRDKKILSHLKQTIPKVNFLPLLKQPKIHSRKIIIFHLMGKPRLFSFSSLAALNARNENLLRNFFPLSRL